MGVFKGWGKFAPLEYPVGEEMSIQGMPRGDPGDRRGGRCPVGRPVDGMAGRCPVGLPTGEWGMRGVSVDTDGVEYGGKSGGVWDGMGRYGDNMANNDPHHPDAPRPSRVMLSPSA